MKKNVSVLGLGSMGSVIARLLSKAGFGVTGWNRSTWKTTALRADGCVIVPTVTEAVRASDIIIVCVSTYESSDAILKNDEVEEALRGKTMIQLSTGTPLDAANYFSWARAKGVHYLDGAIMVTPGQMGTEHALVFVSGDEQRYRESVVFLKALSPTTVYLGTEAKIASTLDLALLSYFFSGLIGFAHAASICKREGVDITVLNEWVRQWSPAMGSIMSAAGDMIDKETFVDTESTVQTCYLGMQLIHRHAAESGISRTYTEFATRVFQRAMDAGLSNEDGAAIYKVL